MPVFNKDSRFKNVAAIALASAGLAFAHDCSVVDMGDYKYHYNCHANKGSCDLDKAIWIHGDQFFNCTCYDGSWSVECPEDQTPSAPAPKTPKQNCEDSDWSGDGWKCDDDGAARFVITSRWWFWAIMIPLGLFIGFLIIRCCIRTCAKAAATPDSATDLELARRPVRPMQPVGTTIAAPAPNQPVGVHLEQKGSGFVTVRDDPVAVAIMPPPQTKYSTPAEGQPIDEV